MAAEERMDAESRDTAFFDDQGPNHSMLQADLHAE
jgi:hypothetical protein